MFFLKSDIKQNKTAGKLATEVRIGDAPTPPFSIKTNQNQSTNLEIGFWRSAAEAAACKCAAAGLSPAFRGVPDHS